MGIILLLVILLSPIPGAAAPISDNRFGIAEAYASKMSAADTGASWESIIVRWDDLQPGGAGDWKPSSEIDSWIPAAVAAGREVVVVLVGTPAWATEGQPGVGVPSGLYLASTDPANTWGAFINRAVSHYSAKGVNRFVIWRDQNLASSDPDYSWEGTEEDYYQLVKTASLVAKNVNPQVKIHLGGYDLADPSWLGRFLDIAMNDASAASNGYYFDVVTVHGDFLPDQINSAVANSYYVMNVRRMALKEVWVSEISARPAIDEVYPEGQVFREFSDVTEEHQAAFILQAFALAFDAGASRVGVYRLVDDLTRDDGQAFGLIRADGSPREAFTAYQLVTRYYANFVYARRVDEQSFPLIDYTRLTGANRVTHIAWARTGENATLLIPARTSEALLVDIKGNELSVRPDGGYYRLVVEGTTCSDLTNACELTSSPWLLIEEGIPDLLNDVVGEALVETGGTVPTPDPAAILTATAAALPTSTPTTTPTDTPVPSVTPTTADVVQQPASDGVEEVEVTPSPSPDAAAQPAVSLSGLLTQETLPPVLIILGALVIVGGLIFYLRGAKTEAQGTEAVDPSADSPD